MYMYSNLIKFFRVKATQVHFCDRQTNGLPKGFHILIPGTSEDVTWHGKEDFADVIKNLEMKRLFSINHGDPKCYHKDAC